MWVKGSAAVSHLALAGAAALLGGVAWTVKGIAILASGAQPPLLFEVAPALFGTALALLATDLERRRAPVGALGAAAAVAGLVALATEIVGEVWGPAILISSVALLVGQLLIPPRGSLCHRLAFTIGAVTLPALALGGLLAERDERLLEVPLVALALMWVWLGIALLERAVERRGLVGAG